jgi:hypothetical protein
MKGISTRSTSVWTSDADGQFMKRHTYGVNGEHCSTAVRGGWFDSTERRPTGTLNLADWDSLAARVAYRLARRRPGL